MPVETAGKSFALRGSPFHFRGVEYGPRRASETSASPPLGQFAGELAEIRASGFTVASVAAADAGSCETAADNGVRLLVRYGEDLWESLRGAGRREHRSAVSRHEIRLRSLVREWRAVEAPLAIAFEAPPVRAVARSLPPRFVRNVANRLAASVREEDARLLTGWRAAWPVADGCPEDVDFLIVDIALGRHDDVKQLLLASHRRVGDRPVVLGTVCRAPEAADEPAPDAGSVVDVALACGVGGILSHRWPDDDGVSETAPAAAKVGPFPVDRATPTANRRSVRDLKPEWPSISIVINAYNAEPTIGECLTHCERLEYPELDLIVVDDGSTDGTPTIAASHPAVRLVTTSGVGLPAARNVGYRAAKGDLVAYLDADAYPTDDWPWYIALAALGAGGAGGPNVPPPNDPISARVVAHSPGNPVPQLRDERSAMHVPGCNMAFWKRVLEALGGFDSGLFGSEDLEFEWRVLETGQDIGYHPAALVWHHRRPGLWPYLRQQRYWGRSHAFLERRYPERFPRGYRVRRALRRLDSESSDGAIGAYVRVECLSLARPEPPLIEFAHQWGMPVAAVLACSAPIALADRRLLAPAAAASSYVVILFCFDFLTAAAGRRRAERTAGFRARLATFRVLRPLAFRWGYVLGKHAFRDVSPDLPPKPTPVTPGRQSPGLKV